MELPELSDAALREGGAAMILTHRDVFKYGRNIRLSTPVNDARNATRSVFANREKMVFA